MLFNVNMLLCRQLRPTADDKIEHIIIERVLWVNELASHIVTIDINPKNERAWPHMHKCSELDDAVAAGTLTVQENDPYRKMYSVNNSIPEKQRQRRDNAWSLIQGIVTEHEADLFNPKVLGPLVRTASHTTGKHHKRIYVCLRKYWQGGQTIDSLLPRYDRSGGKGKERPVTAESAKRGRPSVWSKRHNEPDGVNITSDILEQIRRSKSFFYEKQKLSFADTYHQFYTLYYHAGFEIRDDATVPILCPPQEVPTLNQFRYWFYKGADLEKSLRRRLGQLRFDEDMRPLLGNVRKDVYGPGSMFYYDSTIADVYLVSRLNRNRIVGRPVIHILIDLFTGLIVGLAVLLEDSSWEGAKLALLNMVEDKYVMCQTLGITDIYPEDWPCQHLPRAITGDRGELFTQDAEILCSRLKIHRATTPPYRPTWKAAVERTFRTLNDLTIDDLPGHVVARRRGQHDYRLDALLNLDEFRKILIDAIVRQNRSHTVSTKYYTADMIAEEVEPYSSELWQWGIENRAGQLHTRSLTAMRLDLLLPGHVTVKRDGLHFGRVRYTSPSAEREQWFVKAETLRKPWHESVRYDKLRNELFLERENDLERCTLHPEESRFIGCDWYDIEDFYARENDALRERSHRERQERVSHEAVRDAIIKQAEAEASATREDLSKRERLGGIRENRQEENRRERMPKGTPSSSSRPQHSNQTDPTTTRRLQLLNDDD